MNKTLVISDLHLGVQRTGGTTLASASALREYAHEQHRKLLNLAVTNGCDHVLVNGDLTDAYDIPLMQALSIYETVDTFLQERPHISVTWALGNHDLSKSSDKLGSVAFVGALLGMKYGRFKVISGPQSIWDDSYVIPHVTNQDVLDLELSRVPAGTKWLFLHANLDNKFACDADHSLNVSRDQAKELKAAGVTTVFGHEHQGREILKGSVIVVGNQFPTSIADCLSHGDGQKDGTKRAMVIDHTTNEHRFITTWTPDDADGWFARVDWRELAGVEEEGRGFVRVEGDATAAEAADVIKAISAFRQRSQSFVITNAVKIEQVDAPDDISASVEEIKTLSVLDLLMEQLSEPQQVAVRKLLEESK